MPTGLHVLHPFTGEPLEIWVANYVLMAYGEGAVMGVPAHDERDFEFAVRNALPVVTVVRSAQRRLRRGTRSRGSRLTPTTASPSNSRRVLRPCASSRRWMRSPRRSSRRDWDASACSSGCATGASRASATGAARSRSSTARTCGEVPVPDEQLPVLLPEDLVPDGSGNPLARSPAFYECRCPKCGQPARRETDTMDTFVDSSWYFMRYACPDSAGHGG